MLCGLKSLKLDTILDEAYKLDDTSSYFTAARV